MKKRTPSRLSADTSKETIDSCEINNRIKIKHIFFISTQFHLKVAETIAKDLHSVIFVIFKRLRKIQPSHLHQTIYIDLKTIKIPILKQFIAIKKVDDVLNQICFEDKVNLYYPNDYGTEFQYGISFFAHYGLRYRLHMFEDGIGAYTSRNCYTFLDSNTAERFKVFLFKILLRDRFFNTVGDRNTLAEEYYALFPNAFREEIEKYGKTFHLLDHVLFTSIESLNSVSKNTHILLTSCIIEDGYVDKKSWISSMENVAKKIATKTNTLHVKPHPRESNDTISALKSIFESYFQEVIYIETSSAAEDYIATIENKNDLILYGFISSTLFYGKQFFPEIKIVSLQFTKFSNPYMACTSSSYDKIISKFTNDF